MPRREEVNVASVRTTFTDLCDKPRWTCWQETPSKKPGLKPGKPPINPKTGGLASPTDQKTWATLDEALDYWERNFQGRVRSGVQFALIDDGIVGIDLDDCRDPDSHTIEPWAVEMIARLKTYTEVSPSRTGIRMFARGKLPPGGRHKGKVEMYSDKKVVTVTGRRITAHGAGDAIAERTAELAAIHAEVFGLASTRKPPAPADALTLDADPEPIDDNRLERFFAAKPEARAKYHGERNGHPSQSEADMALANYAAAWGLRPAEIHSLLLHARENANAGDKPHDYYQRTIAKALAAHPAKTSIPTVASVLRRAWAVDPMVIGNPDYVESDEHETASWEDMAKVVAGVRWLVPSWIPAGMLTGLIAPPKTGKSSLVVCLSRSVILGEPWFTGRPGPEPGCIIYVDTEHSAAINLDRARGWGLPLDKIKTPLADPLALFSLDNEEHLDRLCNVVCKYKAPLVIVDSFRGAHDGDENSSKIVKPLRTLGCVAEVTGTAIIIIHHTKKLVIGEDLTPDAGRGSNAFLAAVRCQLAIDQPDLKSEWRRLQVLGNNLGIAPKPVGFRQTKKGLEFGAAPERPTKESAKGRAQEFLRERLKPGQERKAADMIDEAKQHGISEDSLHRAREEMGIKPRKIKDGWVWGWPSK